MLRERLLHSGDRAILHVGQYVGGEYDGAIPGEAKATHYDTYMRLFWEHLIGMREWLDKLQKQIA